MFRMATAVDQIMYKCVYAVKNVLTAAQGTAKANLNLQICQAVGKTLHLSPYVDFRKESFKPMH